MSVKRTETLFYAAYGMALGAAGLAFVRVAGHVFFRPGGGWRLAVASVVAAPLSAVVTASVFERMGLPRRHWFGTTALIVAAAAVPDALSVAFADTLFPRIGAAGAGSVAAWIVATDVVLLAAGLAASHPVARLRRLVRSA